MLHFVYRIKILDKKETVVIVHSHIAFFLRSRISLQTFQ